MTVIIFIKISQLGKCVSSDYSALNEENRKTFAEIQITKMADLLTFEISQTTDLGMSSSLPIIQVEALGFSL